MAANHQYVYRMTSSGTKWRWLLKIRTSEANDILSFTDINVPVEALEILSAQASYKDVPAGLPAATVLNLQVDYAELTGTELEYLASQLKKSFTVLGGSEIGLNTFILLTDGGDADLDEADYLVFSVTAQKPTIERDLDIDGGMAEIETHDAAHLTAEMSAIDEYYSLGPAAPTVGTAAEHYYVQPSIYDWITPSFKHWLHPVDTTVCEFRGLVDGLQTSMLRLMWQAASNVRKKSFHLPTFETFMSGRDLTPVHGGWTFYRYDESTNDTSALVALGREYLRYIARTFDVNGEVSGAESLNSEVSLAREHDNWLNALQVLSETWAAKSRIVWMMSGADPLPVIQSDTFFGDFGEAVTDIGQDEWTIETPITLGTGVLKSATCLSGPRNENEDNKTGARKDITEYVHGSQISIASDEWGVPMQHWTNVPTAGEVLVLFGSGSDRSTTPYRIYFDTLYCGSTSISGRWVRIHHHVEISDGVDTYQGDDAEVVFADDMSAQLLAVKIGRIQKVHGCMPGTVAKAFYGAFARVDQADVHGTMEFDPRVLPGKLGQLFSLDPGASVEADTGTLFDEPTVLNDVSWDFETETVQCAWFVRGSEGTL